MNQEKLAETKEYLLSLNINPDDKRYAMSFCKKMDYINDLINKVISDTHEHVSIGYGNVNSKICFVVKDENTFEIIKPLIQEILEKFHLNFWNVYVTFVDKTKTEYANKYTCLINELHAIKPGVMFVVGHDDKQYNEICNAFTNANIALPKTHFYIDIQKLGSTEPATRKELWMKFKYLINYKEIE